MNSRVISTPCVSYVGVDTGIDLEEIASKGPSGASVRISYHE
jgi:hypothetical protein